MFVQSDAIRDYVFPVVSLEVKGTDIKMRNVLGSGFIIGNRGFALTAEHVIRGREIDRLAAIFVNESNQWVAFEITAREQHPQEDVALIKLSGGPWKSFFRVSTSIESSSCRYRLFGYPDDTTFELSEAGQAIIRPDLIYNEGYIRRRYTGTIPTIRGRCLYELSEIAGTGCSGAPISKMTAPVWEVIGIYVGEKHNDRATSVSYAVRGDAFCDWVPDMLGLSILQESENVSL